MLKVLGRVTSINVRKVLWALDEMGVSYEREDWGKPNRDPNVPEFLALNPNAQVPVIVDGEFVLWDSSAILLYLAEFYGQDSLWTPDAYERARVYQWLSWQASDLGPSWSYVVQAILRNNPPNPDPARIAASIAAWTQKMLILERQLDRTGAYVAGASFSLADIVIGLSTHRWMRIEFDKPDLPAVGAHYAKMQSRPAGNPYLSASMG